MKIILYRLLALVVLILLWWWASTSSPLVPTPAATFRAAIEEFQKPTLWVAVGQSLFVYLAGFFAAVVVGVPVGLLLGGFRPLGQTFEIYINALMATPRIAFIPLIIVFLGLGYEAKIFIIFLGAVMPIIVNTYAGVLNADGELVEMARSAGARRSQIFLRILLPGALPFVVVGLRVGATIGLINTVVAEFYTALTGIGGLIRTYGGGFRMAPYFVVVLILSVVGVIVTQALRFLETRMDRWRYQSR